MSDHLIDQAILSSVGLSWAKVAMVITRVAKATGAYSSLTDEGCELIARRIEALVGDGRLVAQGEIKNWRFSEIRQPSLGTNDTPA